MGYFIFEEVFKSQPMFMLSAKVLEVIGRSVRGKVFAGRVNFLRFEFRFYKFGPIVLLDEGDFKAAAVDGACCA